MPASCYRIATGDGRARGSNVSLRIAALHSFRVQSNSLCENDVIYNVLLVTLVIPILVRVTLTCMFLSLGCSE